MPNGQAIYSVTQVNHYIKDRMDADNVLSYILVSGELSNYKIYPSGHHYFSLKDDTGSLRGVMFRGAASQLKFRPEHGMQVIVGGKITVFPRDGQYQIQCFTMTPNGVGELHVAFEQLKERLYQEGLFDERYKKPLPPYPKKIVLITSSAGAAIQDMLRVLDARYPLAEVLLIPVRVQGKEAADEIARALRYTSAHRLGDVIITGRGGGSMEDLWCFNDERVARAIFDCEIPVISAVGHEPDVTIADFVADVRAATPSNGAEHAVPEKNEIYGMLGYLEERMLSAMAFRLEKGQQRLEQVRRCRELENPLAYLTHRREALEQKGRDMMHGLERSLLEERERFGRMAASLDAMSPLKVLGRGYTFAQNNQGDIVTSVEKVKVGDILSLKVRDGRIDCKVEEIQDGRKEKNL